MPTLPPKSDLPQGTLDLLILKVIALGPVHGYAISQRLEQVSRGLVQAPEGSLYAASSPRPGTKPTPAAKPSSTDSLAKAAPRWPPKKPVGIASPKLSLSSSA